MIDFATDAGVLPMRPMRLIVYDMRVGVVGQIAAGAEVTDRGFAGEPRRIRDRAGRETYALISGDGSCPTVLVHGGVGSRPGLWLHSGGVAWLHA